jgi:hypothetical protein
MQFYRLKRREFIALLGGATLAWPLGARAQQPIGQAGKMPRIGILMPGSSVSSEDTLKGNDAFVLAEQGDRVWKNRRRMIN